MKKLALLMFAVLVLSCANKPNQTVYNRPNTALAPFVDDFKIYPHGPTTQQCLGDQGFAFR